MADAAVGFLLDNLEQLLSDKDTSSSVNISSQVKSLKTDLKVFKGFIKDSSEQRSNTEIVKAIVHSINNVIYEAEDAIDRLVVETARFKEKGVFRRAFNANAHSKMIQKVTQDIQRLITVEVKQIYDKKLLERTPDKLVYEKKTPVVEEENVVGLDETAESIIKRLNNLDNQDLDILTVVGMPGLGKTTLVRKIYNDPAIEYEFFMRAWVYVSQKYSRREVYISILSKIKQESNYLTKSDEVIAEELRRCLEQGRYLIVVDDVWTPEAWEDIKKAFPKNDKGSRILITSRKKDVAEYANPGADGTHNLKFLSPEESWELLESKVFGKGKCPSGELGTVGFHVANKCQGLPLAIVVIAGILFNKRDQSDWWKTVGQNVSKFVVKNEKQFMEVIALSYNELPYYLKSCFLYLGVFPEDYEIPVWNLVYLWIAEGFIEHDGELSLEETAENCVADLVNRNLMMVSKRRPNGKIKTCHVHDMLYDFCKKEAASQNFCQEIKETNAPTEVTPENYRRVSIHSKVLEYISSKPPGQRVRSVLCFQPDETIIKKELITAIPKAFELLRVLDIKTILFTMFPKELLQLALLRYLAFFCDIKSVPKTISQLFNMQTLIIHTKSPALEFKEEIWKLYQLRHLSTNSSAVLPGAPSNARKGKENVKSLSMISPESCTERVFSRTPYITKLGVRGKISVLFKSFDNVSTLQMLTNLKLYNDRSSSETTVLKLPLAGKFPSMLKKLTLANMLLDSEQMEILENLKNIEVLKLKDILFKEEIWELKEQGFGSLLLLYIERTNLVTWKASSNYFPRLKSLIIKHCESLKEIPYVFAEKDSFQMLDLYRTNKIAAASARKIQGIKNIKATKGNNAAFKLSVYPPDL